MHDKIEIFERKKNSPSFGHFVEISWIFMDVVNICRRYGHLMDIPGINIFPILSISRLENMNNVVKISTMLWTFSSLFMSMLYISLQKP